VQHFEDVGERIVEDGIFMNQIHYGDGDAGERVSTYYLRRGKIKARRMFFFIRGKQKKNRFPASKLGAGMVDQAGVSGGKKRSGCGPL
jgi:hypothetical protein